MSRRIAWLILGTVFSLSLLAPALAPYDPLAVDLEHNLMHPTQQHPFGTDLLGRDVLSRGLHGGQRTLGLAFGATLFSVMGGLVLGCLAAFPNPLFRLVFGSLMNALLALPTLLTALVVLTVLGEGFLSLLIAVGLSGIGPFAHTTQQGLINLGGRPYIESAVSVGATPQRVLIVHLLPNLAPLLLTFAGVTFSWALLNGAALAFLGFSGSPDVADWGVMLAAGRQTFAVAPYEALTAGLLLMLTVWGVNRLCQTG